MLELRLPDEWSALVSGHFSTVASVHTLTNCILYSLAVRRGGGAFVVVYVWGGGGRSIHGWVDGWVGSLCCCWV